MTGLQQLTRTAAGRRVPVPVWARWAVGGLLGAELLGYSLRVGGAPTAISHPLSMDLPFSLPRMLVATVFLMAAVAAGAGAVRLTRRRSWWAAVASICGLVALVKAGSQVHKWALVAIDGYAHPVRALTCSALVAVVVLGWLYWLSREDRRDRRRVLRWLAAYAGAAGGLSTITGVVEGAVGHASAVAATATLVEESAEAVTAVGVLVAVLVGVAPKLVFPPGHPFRRSDDVGSPAPGERRTAG
jgi:hypothetical protein